MENSDLLLLQKQYQWPMIARDIVLLTSGLADGKFDAVSVANAYGIPLDQFQKLLALDTFKHVLANEISHYKELGAKAGYNMRAEALITDIQERLYMKVRNDELEDKHTLQFLQLLMRSVGLDSVPNEDKEDKVPAAQVNIAFNIPKLSNPKLSHLVNAGNNNIIDAVT